MTLSRHGFKFSESPSESCWYLRLTFTPERPPSLTAKQTVHPDIPNEAKLQAHATYVESDDESVTLVMYLPLSNI